jgi:hypothetical protein
MFAKLHALGIVDVEHGDRGASRLRQSFQEGSSPAEMPVPALTPWVEEGNDLSSQVVDTRKIWSFAQVASIATEAKSGWIVAGPMLAGDNVIDVEAGQREQYLRQSTVFTSIAGTLANQSAQAVIH